jgi:hypothetical protein
MGPLRGLGGAVSSVTLQDSITASAAPRQATCLFDAAKWRGSMPGAM